jgi:uncharacterized protein
MMLVLGAAGAGCGSGSSSGTAPTSTPVTLALASHIVGATRAAAPFEDFEQVRATIRSRDGRTHTPCLLLARTEALRNRGLMHVAGSDLGGHAGMVFAFDADATGSFTMQDTLIPLSVVFLDPSGRTLSTTDMTPCPSGSTTCPTYPGPAPYRGAIEVPAGQLAAIGLDDGATVQLGGECHTSPS